MSSKTNRKVLSLTLTLGLVLAIGLAIAPISAAPIGTWVGNCPMLQVSDATGLIPTGLCYEENVQAGLYRECCLVDVNGRPAKSHCYPAQPL